MISIGLLVRTASDMVDLRALAMAQLAHFGDLVGSRIRIDGPSILVAPHAAQSLGMALHELSTNAGKHGALSRDAGQVDISWRTEDGTLHMTWHETGGPCVATPRKRGFGTTVIDQMASSSLNGKVDLIFAPAGLRWVLSCPLEALRKRR